MARHADREACCPYCQKPMHECNDTRVVGTWYECHDCGLTVMAATFHSRTLYPGPFRVEWGVMGQNDQVEGDFERRAAYDCAAEAERNGEALEVVRRLVGEWEEIK